MRINVTCKVVDAPCGAGKTSAAINFINSSPEETRFLFITPFLEEVERIKNSCTDKNFEAPDNNGSTKFNSIKGMIKAGRNIVSTHALFRMFDAEIIRHISEQNYVLIIDEVTSVIEIINMSDDDRIDILERYAHVDDKGCVIWDKDDYVGEFERYMHLCNNHRIMSYSDSVWLWLFPIETFNAFKDIYLLTYLFDAQLQKCYYDYYGLRYEYLNVDSIENNNETEYYFTDKPVDYHTECYRGLIEIIESEKMNAIGEDKFALSKAWYDNAHEKEYDRIKKNCHNFFGNIVKAKTNYSIWTTFKDKKNRIKAKGFTKGFVSLSARATNKYQHSYAAAYLVNVFVNPILKNFFLQKGIEFDEDKYALSELIQWLWRTRIRRGESIVLYIPSSRMRGLLKTWLKGGI